MSKEKLTYFTTIRFLSKYISRHKSSFVLFYFGWLINALLKVYIPITFAIMIDEIVYYQNISLFLKVSLLFAIMLMFSCVLYYFSEMQHSHLSTEYTYDIKQDVFARLLDADAQFMSESNAGDVINTIQNYIGDCVHFVIRNIIHMVNKSLVMIVFIIYVFILGWQIGLLMILIVPISVFVSIKLGKSVKKVSILQKKKVQKYSGWLLEMITGIKDIRLLGAQKKAEEQFEELQNDVLTANVKSVFLTKHAENIVRLVNLLIQLSIYGLAAIMSFQGNMTIGMLLLILTYFTRMTNEVKDMSGMYVEAQNRIASIQHIYELMNAGSEAAWKGDTDLDIKNAEICFNEVTFGYRPDRLVLNNLSLKIQGGERIGICGKSGSGKSTLAYMLAGFFVPQGGYVEIDGQNIQNCLLSSIRQKVGIIQQDVLLFDGSIRQNLVMGKDDASSDEIISACTKAGIYDFISTLPEQLDTLIGTHGIKLSGGQKQRIAIARIYLKNPPIIIFDEATSALDSETEKQIQSAWEDVLAGRTAIVIAHRLSTIKLCEKIAVLEAGQIVDLGSFEQLMKKSNSFKELFALAED